MRQNEKDKKKYIIVGLCAILVVMAVGYASFASNLTINGTSEITSNWCLGFDNTKTNTLVPSKTHATGQNPTGTISYEGETCGVKSQFGANISAHLNQPGDSIEYTLTILNEGSLDAAIDSIIVGEDSVTSDTKITNGNVIFDIKMPASTSIGAGESTTMKVVATFQDVTDITGTYGGENQSVSVKINASQDDGSGGMNVTPASNKYTGPIYRYSPRVVNNGDLIVPGNLTKWCEVNENEGYNSCIDDNFGDSTEQECLTNIDGWDGASCEQGTVTYNGIGDYTTDASTLNKTYYLKHDVVDDIITASYVCFVSDTEHCMQGGDSSFYNANKTLLQGQEVWFNNHSGSCSFGDSNSNCDGGGFNYVNAYSNGEVKASVYGTDICSAYGPGLSSCIGSQSGGGGGLEPNPGEIIDPVIPN